MREPVRRKIVIFNFHINTLTSVLFLRRPLQYIYYRVLQLLKIFRTGLQIRSFHNQNGWLLHYKIYPPATTSQPRFFIVVKSTVVENIPPSNTSPVVSFPGWQDNRRWTTLKSMSDFCINIRGILAQKASSRIRIKSPTTQEEKGVRSQGSTEDETALPPRWSIWSRVTIASTDYSVRANRFCQLNRCTAPCVTHTRSAGRYHHLLHHRK